MNYKLLLEGSQRLKESDAAEVMQGITNGSYTDAQVASILTMFLIRGVTSDELLGFSRALLSRALPVSLYRTDTIDLCGTGGDGKDTFNISTLTAFVLAGAGVPVVKHGNYGASSVSGSSNLLEHLGYRFSADSSQLNAELERVGVTFLHAPLFHPALKAVSHIRKQLGIKTLFNMLGPLVNPAQPYYQLSGVNSLDLARLYAYILKDRRKGFTIIHSLDGYDEVSLTGATRYIGSSSDGVLYPADFGLLPVTEQALHGGGTVEQSAKIFMDVLRGSGTAEQMRCVEANAAMGITCYGVTSSLTDAVAMAAESLESGRALACFTKLMEMQQ